MPVLPLTFSRILLESGWYIAVSTAIKSSIPTEALQIKPCFGPRQLVFGLRWIASEQADAATRLREPEGHGEGVHSMHPPPMFYILWYKTKKQKLNLDESQRRWIYTAVYSVGHHHMPDMEERGSIYVAPSSSSMLLLQTILTSMYNKYNETALSLWRRDELVFQRAIRSPNEDELRGIYWAYWSGSK